MKPYQAVLIASFGGPEGRDEVRPFIENVLRGKSIPEVRKEEVAQHYFRFDGVSPLNAQNRELRSLLEKELSARGLDLPVYWGNRNWKPYFKETLQEMTTKGVKHFLAYLPSPYGSYSSCRQYLEALEDARTEIGDKAPTFDKIRFFFNHPGFIEVLFIRAKEALAKLSDSEKSTMVFTAHSLPVAMSRSCEYEKQVNETCRLVSERCGITNWQLAYQNRSGRPSDRWLEPDILEVLKQVANQGERQVVVMPIGFLSDHMEVIYDLDIEAKREAEALGLRWVRSATPGKHPLMLRLLGDLVEERLKGGEERPVVGSLAPAPDTCPPNCCFPR